MIHDYLLRAHAAPLPRMSISPLPTSSKHTRASRYLNASIDIMLDNTLLVNIISYYITYICFSIYYRSPLYHTAHDDAANLYINIIGRCLMTTQNTRKFHESIEFIKPM